MKNYLKLIVAVAGLTAAMFGTSSNAFAKKGVGVDAGGACTGDRSLVCGRDGNVIFFGTYTTGG